MVMRVLSALMGALTTLCIYLFLREVLPASRWAWTVGALVAALEPMFGFITGGVNNDAALYLASAALLLAIARLLRRGPTPGRLAVAGLLLILGTLVKTQALAFAPAVLLAAGLAWWRSERRSVRTAVRGGGALIAGAAVPLAVYFALGHTVWQRPLVDRVGELAGATPRPFSVREWLSYAWQLYFPRPPFLTTLYPGNAPYELWFKGLVGRFGWLDYGFPGWVYRAVVPCVVVIGLLALRALVAERRRVRRWLGDLCVYLLFALGLAAAVSLAGYRSRVLAGVPFEQARYLLPLLPLLAAVVALGVRGAGRRLAPAVGAAAIVVVLALDVFAQLLTLNRYYG
jgi:4-amino-4-deoxy-L-arabinose transferase-like glycosyltransferase